MTPCGQKRKQLSHIAPDEKVRVNIDGMGKGIKEGSNHPPLELYIPLLM